MRASSWSLAAGVAAAAVMQVAADVYMHNPRGSNNRLNEQSANRNNGNRVFDSQNNNRGGYNKGDVADTAAGDNHNKQYDMEYYQSDAGAGTGKTELSIEWTNQHGCGGNEHGDPHKLNCQIVLQYMCHPDAGKGGVENNIEEGPIDGFRPYCDKECMEPRPDNADCAYPTVAGQKITGGARINQIATATVPACALTEIMTPGACEARGFKWVDAQVNDVWNCPHSCTGGATPSAAVGSKGECEGAGGTWTAGYGNNADRRRMRDGTTTNRQDFTNPNNGDLNEAARANRKRGNVQVDRVYMESWEWYDECYRRERNTGLFTADQNLRNNALGYSSAVYTRQNPNNNRRGYECPEERDHYPYWHPSPWKDIAVLTDRLDKCEWYKQESQNVKGKYMCRNTQQCGNCIRYNSEETCAKHNGRWVQVGAWNKETVKCEQAPWSRVNHLGNGRFGQANTYNWTIPSLSAKNEKCVVRLRYNISTDDYDYNKVNSTFNNDNGNNVDSPVKQNPAVDIGAVNTALRLAINTAQFGRTFQDRSHVLTMKPRPGQFNKAAEDRVKAGQSMFQNRKIYNLNVRGKRCNIVQCFPSVEYDFQPNHLEITANDLVHIQWTGSNTHNNGNPAGDGQAGDAGEGRRGTDRHNIVELRSGREADFGGSFPAPYEENTMFKNLVNAYSPDLRMHGDKTVQMLDASSSWEKVKESWALRMATAGYILAYNDATNGYVYQTTTQTMYGDSSADTTQETDTLQVLLNNAPASFRGGVMQFQKGTYNYMCTRNHNFSNRDQKGHLVVV